MHINSETVIYLQPYYYNVLYYVTTSCTLLLQIINLLVIIILYLVWWVIKSTLTIRLLYTWAGTGYNQFKLNYMLFYGIYRLSTNYSGMGLEIYVVIFCDLEKTIHIIED